ncbi:hypothetical protein QUF88_06685 [Bacillus sp. DX1.1]|uniref:hypothetical protein n=1 Tax=unclassified Bacillus (in: firmicutes) TaxID=185979 RepID=UPI00256FB017|nr:MULTISPECIES: hypothetical protein [unclassified Bacillus (in: firmicutes)]MDM5153532.1 hypothetical protein [Bacillus sp. DX1.1]WJE82484.1 hypothetical protein QRE67_04205 [Bacillus sp. DX3.1]
MKKGNSKFAFKIFLLTCCLFIIYLYISLVFSLYIPYIDLLLLVGFIWSFVEAREGEDGVYRWITLCGTVFILIVYMAVMHDAWKYGFAIV